MYSLPLLYSGKCVAALREAFLVHSQWVHFLILEEKMLLDELKNTQNEVVSEVENATSVKEITEMICCYEDEI